jgi:ferredoxin
MALRRVREISVSEESVAYKVEVNFDLCESNAICMDIAPEVFEVRDDDFLYILNETPSAQQRASVEEAVSRCPKQAISLAHLPANE